DSGPITTSDVGGAKRGSEWWDWSDSKIALEWLLDIGEIVVSQRVGWRRTYDLAERVVPDELRHDDVTDDECHAALVAAGAQVMGVGTAGDIADVHRLPKAAVARHAEEAGLVPVSVPGWPAAWATQEALGWLSAGGRDRHRTTLLSPFDPLVWYRERMERIFGMEHRLEAYTPAHKRVHGYFAMPVLHQGRLVARVDPKRDGSTLVARRVTMESTSGRAVAGVAAALREAATWVGSTTIAVEHVVPASAATSLRSALDRG
ncbi:MAG: crosslink repair DNA glycosylase YcaQ family protein, partial [Actinomycetota bacterium]|nr:crosslink repair DNA glycosylase YcaQ family protein [Actinomycetota bacterium]